MRVLLLLLLCYQECIVDARFFVGPRFFVAPVGPVGPVGTNILITPNIPITPHIPITPIDVFNKFKGTLEEASIGGIVSIFFKIGDEVIEGVVEGVVKPVGNAVVQSATMLIKVTAGAVTAVLDAAGNAIPGLRVLTSVGKEYIKDVAEFLEVSVNEIGNAVIVSISESLTNTLKSFFHGNLLNTIPKLFTKLAANLVIDVCIDLAALALQKVFPDFEGKFDEIIKEIAPEFLSPFIPILQHVILPVIDVFSSKAENKLKQALFNKMLPEIKKKFPKRYLWVSQYNEGARVLRRHASRSLESCEGSLVFLKSTEMTVWTNKWDI